MRCPKCGFISFDNLQTCKQCHKYLADVVFGIEGPTYDVQPPRFLQLTPEEEEVLMRPVEDWSRIDQGMALSKGIDFLGDDDGQAEFMRISLRDDGTFDPGASDDHAPLLKVDFGDVSDLAAPAPDEPALFRLEDEENEADAVFFLPKSTGLSSLEDIDYQGLNLYSANKSVSSATAERSAIKTGTALDNFDIDLDALFIDDKEEAKTT